VLTAVESENRYLVKARSGETVFVAAEQSSEVQRQCCGSSRAFTMRLSDTNRQEAILFKRPVGASLCCFPCCLQVKMLITRYNLIDQIQICHSVIGRVCQRRTNSRPRPARVDNDDSGIFHPGLIWQYSLQTCRPQRLRLFYVF
jgi:Scramblase